MARGFDSSRDPVRQPRNWRLGAWDEYHWMSDPKHVGTGRQYLGRRIQVEPQPEGDYRWQIGGSPRGEMYLDPDRNLAAGYTHTRYRGKVAAMGMSDRIMQGRNVQTGRPE